MGRNEGEVRDMPYTRYPSCLGCQAEGIVRRNKRGFRRWMRRRGKEEVRDMVVYKNPCLNCRDGNHQWCTGKCGCEANGHAQWES